MDILKTSIAWTKAEMLSSSFFILFGMAFMLTSLGFWHLGKTDVARAYIIPAFVAGTLLLIIGVGIFFPSQARVASFATAFSSDASAFVAAEIVRADRVLNEYRLAVFRIIPPIVAVCSVLILVFEGPVWRASFVTTIAMMAVILLVDTNANARLLDYREALGQVRVQ